MTLRNGFGAELALPHGNDLRYDLAGTVLRNASGVLRGGLFPPVNGASLLASTATMNIAVAAFSGVAVRDNGPVFIANDGVTNVLLDPAPGANSRLDVIYAVQHDASSYVVTPDADNLPVFGVLKGNASSSPVRNPTGLPAGALELGTALIPSTATNTGSAGVVITPTFLYTAMAGGVLLARTRAELNAFTGSVGGLAVVFSDSTAGNNGEYRWSPSNVQWVLKQQDIAWAGTSDANGFITIPHNLGVVPDAPVVTLNSAASDAITQIQGFNLYSKSATNVVIRMVRHDTHVYFAGNPFNGYLHVGTNT